MRHTRIQAFVGWSFLVALILALNVGLFHEWRDANELDLEGHPTNALLVTSKKNGFLSKRSDWIEYQFAPSASAKEVVVLKSVSREIFNRFQDASEVPVKYLPSSPEVSDIVGNNTPKSILFFAIVLNLGIIVLAVLGEVVRRDDIYIGTVQANRGPLCCVFNRHRFIVA